MTPGRRHDASLPLPIGACFKTQAPFSCARHGQWGGQASPTLQEVQAVLLQAKVRRGRGQGDRLSHRPLDVRARSLPTIATVNTPRRWRSWASVSATLTLNPWQSRSFTLRSARRLSLRDSAWGIEKASCRTARIMGAEGSQELEVRSQESELLTPDF